MKEERNEKKKKKYADFIENSLFYIKATTFQLEEKKNTITFLLERFRGKYVSKITG